LGDFETVYVFDNFNELQATEKLPASQPVLSK